MQLVLRPLRRSDAEATAELIRTAFAAQPIVLDPAPSALGVTADALATHMSRSGGAVAESDGRMAGVILWEAGNDELHISRLAVHPRARRHGIARALLAEADSAARRGGLGRLRLGTRLALTGNRQLFASCGFLEIARHGHPGYAEPTWVEMQKSLA